jgi:hypothetical protein
MMTFLLPGDKGYRHYLTRGTHVSQQQWVARLATPSLANLTLCIVTYLSMSVLFLCQDRFQRILAFLTKPTPLSGGGGDKIFQI